MSSNLDRLRTELDKLIVEASDLHNAMQYACHPGEVRKQVAAILKTRGEPNTEAAVTKFIEALPNFESAYQKWFAQARAVVKQLLPDHLDDFVSMYERPKSRKQLNWDNYVIADYLQGLASTLPNGPTKTAAIPQMTQQLRILQACEGRFASALFDIKQLVQADLFDSELDVARELAKHKFIRPAGVVAGVVLEKHLSQVCSNHGIQLPKKMPSISDYNNALRENGTIEIPQWRSIQHLGDLRNLCGHSKEREPTADEVGELIAGVAKATKTLF